jgi:quinol---cytochrome c reductase iron-sulfur subunit
VSETEHAHEPVDAPRAERRAATGFVVSALASAGLAIVYWRGGQPQVEGVLLAVAFGGLGYGFVVWANRLLPQGPYGEERHELVASAAEQQALGDDLERGGELGRRTLLVRTLTIAVAGIGAAALFPIRSLGPRPGHALLRTAWRGGGKALVTGDGRLVLASEVPLDGLVTVFPQGHVGSADAQAVLMRVAPGLLQSREGRESWTPDGLVAYSKVCTHAGCPVGLYQPDSHQLLCPCHQSSFDVLDGAKPTFGPAAWPLPQLPLSVGPDGVVRATGDFSEPIGPGYWREKK